MNNLLECLDVDNRILQQPLVTPPVDLSYIDDIYFPLKSDSDRWRSFIDCDDWDPEQFHNALLKRRAYHARMYWEHALLISFTESNWLSLPTLEMVKNAAALSLRMAEFEIASYQLTCGMIAFRLDHPKLLDCAIGLFTTMVWMAENLLKKGVKSKDRRQQVSDLRSTRPFSVDSKKELAAKLDGYIFAIKEMLKKGGECLMEPGMDQSECLRQLKQCVLLLDGVFVILQ